jgi:hypothetical protein
VVLSTYSFFFLQLPESTEVSREISVRITGDPVNNLFTVRFQFADVVNSHNLVLTISKILLKFSSPFSVS